MHTLLAEHWANLHPWFRPGGENDFMLANPLRFELANLQVVLDPWFGYYGAYLVALGVAALGTGLWIFAVSPNRECSPVLALTSALSFLPVYHRVYHTWHSDAGAGLDLLVGPALMRPIQSFASAQSRYLSPASLHSWWWNFVIAPYPSWTLLAFSAVLLYAFLISPRSRDHASVPPFKAATSV